MLPISAPWFLACQHPKGIIAVEYCFPNYSLIGMCSRGAKGEMGDKEGFESIAKHASDSY